MQPFLEKIRALEEKLFASALDETDSVRMKSSGYSWHYRPSHHAETGLVTEEDVARLSQPGKRLLSVGANPAYLEKILCELGIPKENILVADIVPINIDLPTIEFDMTQPWPEIGECDLIIFPESLCIALKDRIKKTEHKGTEKFSTDAQEAKLLAHVLNEALKRLKDGGEIRANGPQSHPNVVKAARAELAPHELDYQRYFLRVRKTA